MFINKVYTKNIADGTDALAAVWFSNCKLTATEMRSYICQLGSASQTARISVYEWYGKEVSKFTCNGAHVGHSTLKRTSLPGELSPIEKKVIEGLPNSEWVTMSMTEMIEARNAGRVIRRTPNSRWLAAQDSDFFTMVRLADGSILELPTCWKSDDIKEVFNSPSGIFDDAPLDVSL